MRTVYLGTSEFAAACSSGSRRAAHRPALVVTRPDAPRGPRPQARAAAGRRARRASSGSSVIQPERPARRRTSLERIAAAEPEVLVRLRLRRADQGAAAVATTRCSTCTRRCCRAGAGRRRSSGRSWPATRRPACRSCALTAGLDSGPVCLQAARADRRRRRLRHARRAAGGARRRAARAGARRAPAVRRAGRGAASPTRTRSSARDRALDPTRPPRGGRAHGARAAPAHRRAAAAARRRRSSA